MSKRGENIYKRKDGRWEGRLNFSEPERKRLSVYGKTYKEVKNKLKAVKLYHAHQNSNISVTEAVDLWLSMKGKSIKESTMIKYKNLAKRHILPFFKNVPVHHINRETVERFAKASSLKRTFRNAILSSKTIRDMLRILRCAIEYSCGKTDFSWDVSDYIPSQKSSKRAYTLTDDDQKKIESLLYDDTNGKKVGILLCLYTGIRIGELCALKWNDISLSAQVISVSKTLQRLPYMNNDSKQQQRTRVTETAPKSEDSQRIIPLADFLVQILEKIYPQNNSAYLLTGTEKPTEPRSYSNFFKRVLRDANADNYNFHALRHTFATRCIESGMDIKSLSKILGHSSVKITLDRYVHPSAALMKDGINKMAESRQKMWSEKQSK